MNFLSIVGKIEVCFSGFQAERFLRICKNNHIPVYDLKVKNICINDKVCHQYEFITYWFYDKYIRQYADKLTLDLHIKKQDGLVRLICRNRKRMYFLLLFIICLYGLYYLDGALWHITVSGNYQLSKEQIIDFLDKQECSIGTRLRRIDCNSLEEKLRMEYPYITWVCFKIIGTELEITVKENDYNDHSTLDSSNETKKLGCAIIANENGLLTNMVIRNGVTQCCVGDEISYDEILLDGKVPVYDIFGNEIVDYILVEPDGDFWIQKKQSYSRFINHCENKTVMTGRKMKNSYLIVGKYSFGKRKTTEFFEHHLYIRTFKQLCLLNRIYLPIYYGEYIEYETCEYNNVISYDEMLDILSIDYECYKTNLISEGTEIINDNNVIIDCDNGLRLDANLIIQKTLDITYDVN